MPLYIVRFTFSRPEIERTKHCYFYTAYHYVPVLPTSRYIFVNGEQYRKLVIMRRFYNWKLRKEGTHCFKEFEDCTFLLQCLGGQWWKWSVATRNLYQPPTLRIVKWGSYKFWTRTRLRNSWNVPLMALWEKYFVHSSVRWSKYRPPVIWTLQRNEKSMHWEYILWNRRRPALYLDLRSSNEFVKENKRCQENIDKAFFK